MRKCFDETGDALQSQLSAEISQLKDSVEKKTVAEREARVVLGFTCLADLRAKEALAVESAGCARLQQLLEGKTQQIAELQAHLSRLQTELLDRVRSEERVSSRLEVRQLAVLASNGAGSARKAAQSRAEQ